MKRIQLRGKHSHLFALVDDKDFELVSRYNWWGKPGYKGIIYVYGKLKDSSRDAPLVYMHRLLLNARLGQEIDHRNHNVLNNQRFNIRICTRSQNAANCQSKVGTSRYKGVTWHERDMNWKAQIAVPNSDGGCGKQKSLGCFNDEIVAAQVYDKAAKEYYGEFACLNFPENR